MKALVYGNEKTIEKLAGLLAKEGIKVEGREEAFSGKTGWTESGRFDLVIIDSKLENAEMGCRTIRKQGDTPIALLVHPKQANWKKLQSMDADCYLSETREDMELAARLKAVIRRFFNPVPMGNILQTNAGRL